MASAATQFELSQATQERSVWRRRLGVFWTSWDARVSVLFLAVMVIIALVPTGVWPDSASDVNLSLRHVNPGDDGHIFGTDALGRDMFYRILLATRLTLLISGVATIIATVSGTAAGLIAGYIQGYTDTLISRVVDIMLAFPIILLVLALVAALGQSSLNVILVLGVSGWAGYARVIRSSTLSLSQLEFVEAARCIGARNDQIIIRHLLPNVASPMLVLSTLILASFILVESAISFLGLGPAPPNVTWGGLIGDGRNYLYEAWWVTLVPGVAITLTVLAFNLMGDALRDAFDPYTTRPGTGGP